MDANKTKWWHWLRAACVKDDLMPAQVRRPPAPFCSRHHGYPEDSICLWNSQQDEPLPAHYHSWVCLCKSCEIEFLSVLFFLHLPSGLSLEKKKAAAVAEASAMLSSSLCCFAPLSWFLLWRGPGSSPPRLPRTMSALSCEARRGHKLAIRPLEGDMLLSFNLVILLRGACKTALHLNVFVDLGEIYSIWLHGAAIVVALWQWEELRSPPAASASINSRKTVYASSNIAGGQNLSCYDHKTKCALLSLIGSSRPTTTCFTSCNTIKGVSANDKQGSPAL